jgi:hypothetical protein
MVKLTTSMNVNDSKVTSAQFTPGQDGGQTLNLMNEAGQAVKSIKLNKDWQFNVEVCAGTEIPRSRRETAKIWDNLLTAGAINIQDIDELELYMRNQDIPNYQAFIQMKKQKAEEASKQPPSMPKFEDIIKNKDLASGAAALIKAISDAGFSQADGQILKALGLIPDVNTLETAPVDKVTSKSGVGQVVAISPSKASTDPKTAEIGNIAATKLELIDKGCPVQ